MPFLFGVIILLFVFAEANAQRLEAEIKVVSASPAVSLVHVKGKITDSKVSEAGYTQIAFPKNYADVSELDKRIENLEFFDAASAKVETRQISDGVFQSIKPYAAFAYDVRLASPSPQTAAAHVSWLNDSYGLLMLNDLLPQFDDAEKKAAKVEINVPNGWKITTSETRLKENVFDVQDYEKTIFLVGKNQREQRLRIGNSELNLATVGEWQFSDDEAAQMADSIATEYQKMFGEIPFKKAQILILPFPRGTSQPDRWRAETRGSTVTVVSGVVPLKSQALQRLHEQLRHEIFHWWIPNSLNLSGNYDWFYEGFAVYQALRTGVELNQIRFQDYLNTLSSAYDLARNQNSSLIEISNNRWTGANGSVYPKGMIAAFLCDAALLRASGGKRSLADVFRRIYDEYKFPHERQEAGSAILSVLNSYPELQPVVRNYIVGARPLDWSSDLDALGIVSATQNAATILQVAPKPSKRQKDLLDKLGYNQWRKLAERNK